MLDICMKVAEESVCNWEILKQFISDNKGINFVDVVKFIVMSFFTLLGGIAAWQQLFGKRAKKIETMTKEMHKEVLSEKSTYENVKEITTKEEITETKNGTKKVIKETTIRMKE